MKSLKNKILLVTLSTLVFLGISRYSFAETNSTKITLSDDAVNVDGETISSDSSQEQDYKVYYITLAVLAVLLVIVIVIKIKK